MGRLLIIVVLLSLGCRRLTGQWPWRFLPLRPSPRAQALARARALLGVPAGAPRAEIIAAHRRVLFAVHPDRGGTAGLVHEADAARDLLLAQVPA